MRLFYYWPTTHPYTMLCSLYWLIYLYALQPMRVLFKIERIGLRHVQIYIGGGGDINVKVSLNLKRMRV